MLSLQASVSCTSPRHHLQAWAPLGPHETGGIVAENPFGVVEGWVKNVGIVVIKSYCRGSAAPKAFCQESRAKSQCFSPTVCPALWVSVV